MVVQRIVQATALTLSLIACRGQPQRVEAGVPAAPARDLGPACGDARLLPAPVDLARRGPWPVGVRTISVDGLVVEVWYPAALGSDRGRAHERYDLRRSLPATEAAKIPDADNVWLPCECVRDLPVDVAHGPYPAVVFLHGAASFRAQSTFLATHWASRGFIVVAPDLPGIGLAALLGEAQGLPLAAPGQLVDAIAHPPGDSDPFAFIRPRLGAQLAVVGHSLGSLLAGTLVDRPEIEVRIAMAGFFALDGHGSTLILGGDHDAIAPPGEVRARLADAAAPTRMMVVRNAGHLAFTDLCPLGAERGGVLAIARAHGVAIPELLATLATDGCRTSDAPFATTAPAIRAVTAGVLEETLRCDPTARRALSALPQTYDVELGEHLVR
jgi:dienelactone hydrolase